MNTWDENEWKWCLGRIIVTWLMIVALWKGLRTGTDLLATIGIALLFAVVWLFKYVPDRSASQTPNVSTSQPPEDVAGLKWSLNHEVETRCEAERKLEEARQTIATLQAATPPGVEP